MYHNFQKILFLGVVAVGIFFVNGSGNQNLRARLDNSFSPDSGELSVASPPKIAFETIQPQAPLNRFVFLAENPGPLSFYPRETFTEQPVIEAEVGLIADLETGEIYFSKNPEKRWPIASITKLFTAAAVLDEIDREKEIALAPEDFSPESSPSGLKIGDRFRARDLISAMLVASSNESAMALARHYGLNEFIVILNAKAIDWGLTDTFLSDPTGLSAANQSTARDLTKAVQKIYNEYPEVFGVTAQPKTVIPELSRGENIIVSSTNAFAGRLDFLGGKTGYTDEASGNLLSIFSYARRPILVIVLGTSDRFGETEKLITWFKHAFSPSS